MQIVLILTMFGFWLNQTNFEEDNNDSETFEIEVAIKKPFNLSAACGRFAFASFIEFEVINCKGGRFNNEDSVAVIFRCPEFYGEDFFQIGRRYSVHITPRYPSNIFGSTWLIIDEHRLKHYNENNYFWAETADIIH